MGEVLQPIDNPSENAPTYEVQEPTTGRAYSNGRFGEIPISFLYTKADPFCVRLRFYDPENPEEGETTDWELSRRVLGWGYFEASGDGDVRVWPLDKDTLIIKLSPPKAASAQVLVPRDAVRTFLDKTYDEVPAHNEEAIITDELGPWLERILNAAKKKKEEEKNDS